MLPLGAQRVIYAVDAGLGLHFRQVFAAADRAGYTAVPGHPGERATLEHAAFGMMLGEDGRPFRTRAGENVRLSDLLDEAEERAAATVAEKNPALSAGERATTARAVAVVGLGPAIAPTGIVSPGTLGTYAKRPLYGELLFHGPRLHAIETVEGISETGMALRLKSAPKPSMWIEGTSDPRWTTDPMVVDGVFQALILWCRERHGAPSLPARLDAYRQFAAIPGDGVRAVVAVRNVEGSSVVSDIDLVDAGGSLVGRLEGFVCTVSPTLERAFSEGRSTQRPA